MAYLVGGTLVAGGLVLCILLFLLAGFHGLIDGAESQMRVTGDMVALSPVTAVWVSVAAPSQAAAAGAVGGVGVPAAVVAAATEAALGVASPVPFAAPTAAFLPPDTAVVAVPVPGDDECGATAAGSALAFAAAH